MFYALIFFTIITLLWFLLDIRKPRGFPPGPRWYPILGSAPQIARLRKKHNLFVNATIELNNSYGKKDIIGLKIGRDQIVIAFSYEVTKELTHNEDLDGRPIGPFYESRTWGTRKGVIFNDEETWHEQKRFLLRHLKEFGFARQGMADSAQNEAQYLLEDVQRAVHEQTGHAALVSMQDLFNIYMLNTLWTMMAGVRYDRQHRELKELQMVFNELVQNVDMVGSLFSHFPVLRYLAPESSGYNYFLDIHRRVYAFIARELDNHKRNFDASNEPRDLMDSYLRVLANPNHPDAKASFSEKQLMAICLDMFLAGSETTTKSLNFTFLYLILNEDIQVKMQNELDAVIGRGRLPNWKDRENLPYCEAVCHEGLRFFASNSFSIPHRALRNTRLAGFDIPKNAIVMSCFTGMLMDEKYFEEPTVFRPERFIKDGKCVLPEAFAPFGARNRRCMGENMGKQNLFLFTTTLMQNFTFRVPKGQPQPDTVPLEGATPSVKPYFAEVVPR